MVEVAADERGLVKTAASLLSAGRLRLGGVCSKTGCNWTGAWGHKANCILFRPQRTVSLHFRHQISLWPKYYGRKQLLN